MHYESIFNALIMHAPYNALYDLMNNFNLSYVLYINALRKVFSNNFRLDFKLEFPIFIHVMSICVINGIITALESAS